MTEWEQAVHNAARTIFTAYDRTVDLPARQVAEEAHYAGGPSVDELERRIVARRQAERLATTGAAA